MNAITIYLICNVVEMGKLAERFLGGELMAFVSAHTHAGVGELLVSLLALGFALLIVEFLYDRKIFLRI